MMYMIEIPDQGPANCVSAVDTAGLADHLRQQSNIYTIKRPSGSNVLRELEDQLDAHHLCYNVLLVFKTLQEAVDAYADPHRWSWAGADDAREALGRELGNGKIDVSYH